MESGSLLRAKGFRALGASIHAVRVERHLRTLDVILPPLDVRLGGNSCGVLDPALSSTILVSFRSRLPDAGSSRGHCRLEFRSALIRPAVSSAVVVSPA